MGGIAPPPKDLRQGKNMGFELKKLANNAKIIDFYLKVGQIKGDKSFFKGSYRRNTSKYSLDFLPCTCVKQEGLSFFIEDYIYIYTVSVCR